MDFKVKFDKLSDKKVLDIRKELYLNLGYYSVHREFPKLESGLSLFCGESNLDGTNQNCKKCLTEKITYEEKPLCFYIRNEKPKALVPSIKSLVKRFEDIIRYSRKIG